MGGPCVDRVEEERGGEACQVRCLHPCTRANASFTLVRTYNNDIVCMSGWQACKGIIQHSRPVLFEPNCAHCLVGLSQQRYDGGLPTRPILAPFQACHIQHRFAQDSTVQVLRNATEPRRCGSGTWAHRPARLDRLEGAAISLLLLLMVACAADKGNLTRTAWDKMVSAIPHNS